MSDSDLLTVQEVARILGVDDTTVRYWAKEGILKSISLPNAGKRKYKHYRFRREYIKTLNRYTGGESEQSTTTTN